MTNKYTYFWRVDSPFSQHYAVNILMNDLKLKFNCAEQYYMYQKAITFHDYNSAKKILNVHKPAMQKSLGKKIRNFDENIWNDHAEIVVYNGNYNKFKQNIRLCNLLLATENTTLVEASPMDQKWGVGLDASDSRILHENTWRGTNLLGNILTKLRNDLTKEGLKYDESKYTFLENTSNLFFWRTSSPFHLKHLTPFKVNQEDFCSLYQYLAYQLAAEEKIKQKIRNSLTKGDQRYLVVNSNHPNLIKYLLTGNYFKFMGNQNLRAQLLDTAGNLIVFNDPDQILGDGEHSQDQNSTSQLYKVKGRNLIGKSLTFIRDQWLKFGKKKSLLDIMQEFGDKYDKDLSNSEKIESKPKYYGPAKPPPNKKRKLNDISLETYPHKKSDKRDNKKYDSNNQKLCKQPSSSKIHRKKRHSRN